MADLSSKTTSFGVTWRNRPRTTRVPILGLFFTSSPPTIFWDVIAIVVNTVEGVLTSRAVSHIFKEILKGVKPTLTHGDASPTISFIMDGIGIKTSLLHQLPTHIFRRGRRAIFSGSVFGNRFFLQTSTRLMFATGEIRGLDPREKTTITNAYPHNLFASILALANNLKPVKALANQFIRHYVLLPVRILACSAIACKEVADHRR